MAKPRGDMARAGALRLLDGVRQGLALSDQGDALARLVPGDQARAARLAAETLRHQARADRVLDPLLSRRPAPAVLDLLRLGTVEMLELGAPPHGVVGAAVDLARGMGRGGQAAAGMVNAVLRRVSTTGDWAGMGPQRLPDWLRAPLLAAHGRDVVRAIEVAHQAGAPLDLTPRPGADPDIEGAIALPTGSWRVPGPVQVSALPGYAEGAWWVQDAAAALPARLLNPRPSERIADLCAAPGGKTLQLAAAGAEVTAVDISAARLRRVADNLRRCGQQATLVASDVLDWRPAASLDAVLLDAPCSATGTIRRHPDLPFLRDGSGIAALAALQGQLLDHALTLLRPGGRLVYAVCSLLPAEGEDQLAAVLARHPGLTVEAPSLPGIARDWITPAGGLRLRPDLWPDRGGMDGFFMVRLRVPV